MRKTGLRRSSQKTASGLTCIAYRPSGSPTPSPAVRGRIRRRAQKRSSSAARSWPRPAPARERYRTTSAATKDSWRRRRRHMLGQRRLAALAKRSRPSRATVTCALKAPALGLPVDRAGQLHRARAAVQGRQLRPARFVHGEGAKRARAARRQATGGAPTDSSPPCACRPSSAAAICVDLLGPGGLPRKHSRQMHRLRPQQAHARAGCPPRPAAPIGGELPAGAPRRPSCSRTARWAGRSPRTARAVGERDIAGAMLAPARRAALRGPHDHAPQQARGGACAWPRSSRGSRTFGRVRPGRLTERVIVAAAGPEDGQPDQSYGLVLAAPVRTRDFPSRRHRSPLCRALAGALGECLGDLGGDRAHGARSARARGRRPAPP